MGDRSGIALLALLGGACGTVTNFSDASTGADAQAVDGTAPMPDAQERGIVTVDVRTLSNDDLPQAGATVVFVDPDGTAQRVTAGGDGIASAEVRIGGSVTAVWLRENGARLVTIVGVEPGDMLRVGTHSFVQTVPTTMTSVSITPQGGTTTATAYTTCGAYNFDGAQTSIPWNRSCEQPDDDILVISFNGEVASGYVYAGNQPNNPHPATVVMPTTWQFPGAFSAGYVNVPATIGSISATRRVRSGTGSLHSQYIAAEVAGRRTLALTLNGAALVGDSLDLSSWFDHVAAGEQNLRSVRVRRRLPMTSAAEVDVGANLLPFVGQATLDLTMRKITWPQVGEGVAPDAQVTSISYFRTVGTSELMYEWRIVAPGGTGSLTLPELPEAIRDLAPLPTDRTFNGDVALFALDTHDYKRLRSELDINYYEWLYDYTLPQSDTLIVSGTYSRK